MNFSKGHFEVLAASWSSEGQQEKTARREADREKDSVAQKRAKETARVAARRKRGRETGKEAVHWVKSIEARIKKFERKWNRPIRSFVWDSHKRRYRRYAGTLLLKSNSRKRHCLAASGWRECINWRLGNMEKYGNNRMARRQSELPVNCLVDFEL